MCFLYRFWLIYSHRQVILHQPVKFRYNRTIGGGVISIFQDGGHKIGNLLPVSVLVMVLVREDGNLLAYQGCVRLWIQINLTRFCRSKILVWLIWTICSAFFYADLDQSEVLEMLGVQTSSVSRKRWRNVVDISIVWRKIYVSRCKC